MEALDAGERDPLSREVDLRMAEGSRSSREVDLRRPGPAGGGAGGNSAIRDEEEEIELEVLPPSYYVVGAGDTQSTTASPIMYPRKNQHYTDENYLLHETSRSGALASKNRLIDHDD